MHSSFAALLQTTLTIIYLLGLLGNTFCQDTLWLNSREQIVDRSTFKGTIEGYVLVTPESNGLYNFRYYNFTPDLFREVTSRSSTKLEPVGREVSYYDYEQNLIYYTKDYANDSAGLKTYYTKDGILHSVLWCVGGGIDSFAVFYDDDGKEIARAEYQNNKMISGRRPDISSFGRPNYYSFYDFENGDRARYTRYDRDMNIAEKTTFNSPSYPVNKNTSVIYNPDGSPFDTCFYQNSKPLNGVEGTFYPLDPEREGMVIDQKPAYLQTARWFENGIVVKTESYDRNGNALGACVYRNGLPYDGVSFQGEILYTYVDGKVSGEVTQYFDGLYQKMCTYTVVDGQKQGDVVFYYPDKDSTARGTYLDDKPWNGVCFEPVKFKGGHLITVKDGVKEGPSWRYTSRGALVSMHQYAGDVLNGRYTDYFSSRIDPLHGEYRNGEPYSGQFREHRNPDDPPIIVTYEDGVRTERVKYAGDPLKVCERYNFTDSILVKFAADGTELSRGKMYDRARYIDGTFWIGQCFGSPQSLIQYSNGKHHGTQTSFDNKTGEVKKIETYKDGILDGPYYERRYLGKTAGIVIVEGSYRDGEPYNGQFLPQRGGGVQSYKDGKRHGVNTIKLSNNWIAIYNYEEGSREGTATFYNWGYRGPRDTIWFHAEYRNDEPYNGTIALFDQTLYDYKDGKKHGLGRRDIPKRAAYVNYYRTWENGVLEGPAEFNIGGRKVQCEYRAGEPYEGIHVDKLNYHKLGNGTFFYYHEGVRTSDSLVYVADFEMMLYRDKLPYEGYIRLKDDPYRAVTYHEGSLESMMRLYGADTVEVTRFADNSSKTVNKQGEVIRQGIYTTPYSTGRITFIENGEEVNFIEIESGGITSGCIEKELSGKDRILATGDGHISICADDNGTTLIETPKLSDMITKRIYPIETRLPWPFTWSYAWLGEVSSREMDQTVVYINKSTGNEISRCQISGRKRTGISIEQQRNTYYAYRFTEEGEQESFEGTFEEMLIKVAEWNR